MKFNRFVAKEGKKDNNLLTQALTMLNSLEVSSSTLGVFQDIYMTKIKASEYNLRSNEGDISQLIESIKENGLLQPIVVRPVNNHFEIIAGNRRHKACQLLRLKKVMCHIVELDDKKAFEFSLIENIQRETLSVLEEARAFKAYVADYGWGGISELARKIGKSPSYITKKIQLLDLPNNILQSIMKMSLNTSIAEELCSLKDHTKQSELAARIMKRHLSLRKARQLMNEHRDNDYDEFFAYGDLERKRRAFDKLIVMLRIPLNSIGPLIDDNEDEWVMHEVFMQHKNMLHDQIDLLIKEKKKLKHRILLHCDFSAPKR